MTTLFLSPHYDDAIYSCGGTIHTLTQGGATAHVMTVMAGTPTPPLPDTPIVRDNHDRWQIGAQPVNVRRAEDRTATALVGAQAHYLTIPDCIYRTYDDQALYPTDESLWRAPHAADHTLNRLRGIQIPDDVATIYAPLAVGNHVDHQIVRDWGRALQSVGYTVYFYEDYPYLRQTAAVERAKSLLVSAGARLQAQHTAFDDATMQAKIKAMRAYHSQTTSFWESEAAVAAEVCATFASDDQTPAPYQERAWRIVD